MTTTTLPGPTGTDHPTMLSRTEAARLRRLRWAVRAGLTLGVAASIAANVLHARPNLISQVIAAWPPLALLLTVELISRVPSHRRSLAILRLLATAVIAGIAAWVSYWHMAGVAARYGETAAGASYLLPISVDGLVVVASISLVEIAGHIRGTATAPQLAAPADHDQPTAATPTSGLTPATQHQATILTEPLPVAEPSAASPPAVAAPVPAQPASPISGARGARVRPAARPADAPEPPSDHRRSEPAKRDLPDDHRDQQREHDVRDSPAAAPAGARDGHAATRSDTSAAVAYWYRRDPSMHPAEIAAKIGRSERTVRRYWPPSTRRTPHGHHASRRADPLRAS
ncbi:DUF2637 domain-containing protein [Micromonospora sp. WMMC415]|uniref:DUF2637 domain-containing protein n=1 Tax=Micromonospora sp. WMMC415 TaxID=2675222 RepID=UPI0012B4F7C4|nr:DUF2637 domain-containing protein [Micromonospora sp. WMMC415]QGN49806.1 DUF2637 domain-containing protein [Micromonospora sp. WMMC415]